MGNGAISQLGYYVTLVLAKLKLSRCPIQAKCVLQVSLSKGFSHHIQSCVLAPDFHKHKLILDTHFLPHDIPNTAVSFSLFQTNSTPPSVPCHAVEAVCY